jgi:hypothetical protein
VACVAAGQKQRSVTPSGCSFSGAGGPRQAALRARAGLRAAAMDAEAGGHAECSGEAAAVREAQEQLESIRRWQQQVEDGASAFLGPASRLRNLLDVDLTRTENHLLAIVNGLEAARGVQVARP